MIREELLTKIQDLLAMLSEKINIANSNKEYNINIHAENIFNRVLNIVYNLNLENANYEKSANFPSIDLFDDIKKVAVQITSTSSKTKINKTLIKFINNNLENEFETLYVYLLKNRTNYNQQQIDKITKGKFDFKIDKHILTKESIYKELNKRNDIEIIKKVHAILEEEFQLLNSPIFQPLSIGLSFAENDIKLVREIIIELQKFNITVYSNSEILKSKHQEIDNRHLKFIRKSVPKDLDFFMVIITDNYHKFEWTNYKKCIILNAAIKQREIIFPFKIDTVMKSK